MNENNQVLHADRNGIQASWSGHDKESGIVKYLVAVGVAPEDSSVTQGYLDFGTKNEAYIDGIFLNVTDLTQTLYYVNVYAINGAGNPSAIRASHPIHVLRENVPGVIYDGRDDYHDSTYQRDLTSIAMTFSGFESVACGIDLYEWAIGSKPGFSDVQEFTSYGLTMLNETHGQGQAHLQAKENMTYFVTVRAWTGHKCHEDLIVSTSDGIQVDSTPPSVLYTDIGIHKNQTEYTKSLFQSVRDSIDLQWNISDVSGVADSFWMAGSVPGATDIHPEAHTVDSKLPIGSMTADHGDVIIFAIQTEDNAGNIALTSAPPLSIDTTPPDIGMFFCKEYISPYLPLLSCSWENVLDHESPVLELFIGIGSTVREDDVLHFGKVSHHNHKWTYNFLAHSQHVNGTYFVTLRASNIVGLDAWRTQQVFIDDSPPNPGDVQITTYQSIPKQKPLTLECQRAQTYVDVSWEGFSDTGSGIQYYEVALGSYSGGTDIKPFTSVGKSTTHFVDEFFVVAGSTVFAMVRAVDKVGLYSASVSSKIIVSPDPMLTVTDGDLEVDAKYQTSLTTMTGLWNYSDSCPVVLVEWSIMRVDGEVIQKFMKQPIDDARFYSDGVTLENGKMYYNIIRVKDALNRTQTTRSNGITVKIELPSPGIVSDGLYGDINYQQSLTTLSGKWEDFGDKAGVEPTQKIVYYEVAAGNDRQYLSSQTNVHAFVNVGLNTSHTFTGLNLTAKTKTYYITVRAHSLAGSYTDSISNGVQVGFRDEVQPGTVEVPQYQSSVTELKISWTGFLSDFPIEFYQVAIGSKPPSYTNKSLPCDLWTRLNYTFDVLGFIDAGRDTFFQFSNLQLQHSHTYFVTVKATDSVDNCIAVTSGPILIDTTPPKAGIIKAGETRDGVIFLSRTDSFNVSWTLFTDEQSPVNRYKIALLKQKVCSRTGKLEPNSMEEILPETDVSNDTKIEFDNLKLKTHSPYFIKIQATNKAALFTETWSPPIFIDDSPPLPGSIKHGNDWLNDKKYQSSTTSLEGVIALGNTKASLKCKIKNRHQFKEYNGTLPSFVKPLETKSLFIRPQTTLYSPHNVLIKDNDLMLQTKLDVNRINLELSGFTYLLDGIYAGNYSTYMKAARGSNIITSIVIGDPDINIAFKFDLPTIEKPPSNEQFSEHALTWKPNLNETGMRSAISNSSNTTADEKLLQTTTPYDIRFNISYNSSNGREKGNDIPAVGIHILGYPVDSGSDWFLLFWARDEEGMKTEWVPMEYNPIDSYNSFKLELEKVIYPTTELWNVKLHLNNIEKAMMYDVRKPKGIFSIRTWSQDDYVPPVSDPFHPFSTEVRISYIDTPLPQNEPCHYGKPFSDTESKIKELWVGVGSLNDYKDNIYPMTMYKEPCPLCTGKCDYICKESCTSPEFQVVNIQLNNLNLSSGSYKRMADETANKNDNDTFFDAQTYFLIIKAINFAGYSVTTTSNGITIDTTPPVLKLIYCFDPKYSDTEPSEYVGSTESVGAYWEFDEDASEITMYEAGVGTAAGLDNIHIYIPLHLTQKCIFHNFSLPLVDKQMVYVNVRATNAASLQTVKHCTLIVDLTVPDVKGMSSVTEGTVSLPELPKGVNAAENRHQTGIKWSPGPKNVEYYGMLC